MYFAQAPSYDPPADVPAATRQWVRDYVAWDQAVKSGEIPKQNSPIPPWGPFGVNSAPKTWGATELVAAFNAFALEQEKHPRPAYFAMVNSDFATTIHRLENPELYPDDASAEAAQTATEQAIKTVAVVGVPLLLLLAIMR
jgi:hypothetical protein